MTATGILALRFLFAKSDWRGDTAILVQLYCRSDQMLLGARMDLAAFASQYAAPRKYFTLLRLF